MYIIINCPTCGKIIMASTTNRSKTCPHCGAKIPLWGAKTLARTESAQAAVEIIQRLKQSKNKDPNPVRFKKFKA